MNELIKIFNNRELAILFWISVFLVFVLIKAPRSFLPVGSIIKAFFNIKIFTVNLLSWVYLGLIIYLAYKLEMWNSSMIKDTAIWLTITMITLIIKVSTDKKTENTPVKILAGIVQPIVMMEFIVNLESFSLIAEIFLQLFLVVVVFGTIQGSKNNKHLQTYGCILSVTALSILSFGIYKIIIGIGTIDRHKDALNLLFPIWLTLAYTPCLYGLIYFMKKEDERVNRKLRFNKQKWTQE